VDVESAVELAAHKAALVIRSRQTTDLVAQVTALKATVEELAAWRVKAAAPPAAPSPPMVVGSLGGGPRLVRKAMPHPVPIRAARLAPTQKQAAQKLKRVFQGLQTQALRVLREGSKAERPAEPDHTPPAYWDETQADTDLIGALQESIAAAGEAAYDSAKQDFGLETTWHPSNAWLAGYVGGRANLIKGIDQTQKAALIDTLHQGYDAGESVDDLSKRVSSVFREAIDSRAEMIARTETMQAYGSASLAAYQEAGIEKAQMYDGEGYDATCASVNGMVVSLSEAQQLMADEHPNGTRGVAPIVEWASGDQSVAAALPFNNLHVLKAFLLADQQKETELGELRTMVKELLGVAAQVMKASAAVSQAQTQMVPDVTIEQPPIHVHNTVNVPEGAIRIDSPVTIAKGAVEAPQTHFAEGAFQHHMDAPQTVIQAGAVKVEAPITVNNVPEPETKGDLIVETSSDGRQTRVRRSKPR
jgi:hypothetical protein